MLMEEHISGGSCVMTVMPLDETDPSTTSNRRSCMDCQATSTPCWRSGPAGPRTLCNACGIRYRKRRRAILGLRDGVEKKKKKKTKEEEEENGRVYMKEELWKRRKMGEEERAAILLMALSCGGGSAFV